MFDTTKEDINSLTDTDLRLLVGKLCEAELRRINISTSYVTYGGGQDVADGGVDVRVGIQNNSCIDGYIPKKNTVFQVKKYDMSPADIIDEMKPKGILRDSIKELCDLNGAYIIASGASVTDLQMSNRINAMKEAVKDYSSSINIKLDYYDSQRLVSWANNYPAIIVWLREMAGRPLSGWSPYKSWAFSKGTIADEYYFDEEIRILDLTNAQTEPLSTINGINKIRTILNSSGTSVRLVGLSGVGKTRLAQALFDVRVGSFSLNQEQVIYTDMSSEQSPKPIGMAEKLLVLNERVFLVADNCDPKTHQELAKICTQTGSNISLLTIEYDIRNNFPEETEVFKLEPSSEELINKILGTRFDNMGQAIIKKIAEFSGGNARIAIALANSIRRDENIAVLNENILFGRLFWQNNAECPELLNVAKTCALVYSFNINEEKDILAQLAEMTPTKMFSYISELERRELIQKRGDWRAVLPHAIANWLAKRALEDYELSVICKSFENNIRLLTSFSHRLGYLHDSPQAKEIVNSWLASDGMLADITKLNDDEISIFQNVAPVAPQRIIDLIETACEKGDTNFFLKDDTRIMIFSSMLFSFAHEELYFEKATTLLIKLALDEQDGKSHMSFRGLLISLFLLNLSGVNIAQSNKIAIIDKLLVSSKDSEKEWGFELLDTVLETDHYDFFDGFRARGVNGYKPKTYDEWFIPFIKYATQLSTHDDIHIASRAKKILASHLLGLLRHGLINEIEISAKTIGTWGLGWLAIKNALITDAKHIDASIMPRLKQLEEILQPCHLINKAQAFILSSPVSHAYLMEDWDGTLQEARNIGQGIALDEDAVLGLIPEIFKDISETIFCFGQGLADTCQNLYCMWNKLKCEYLKVPEKDRVDSVLRGFINTLYDRDRSLSDRILDESMDDELGYLFPILQSSVLIDEKGIHRLIRSLEINKAPTIQYRALAFGRVHEAIPDACFPEIIKLISDKSQGLEVAIKIFFMRIHGKDSISNELQSVGRLLLTKYDFLHHQGHDSDDHQLSKILKVCLKDDTKAINQMTEDICKRINTGLSGYKIYAHQYKKVLLEIAKNKPLIFLDSFFGTEKIHRHVAHSIKESGAIKAIDRGIIIDWCSQCPEKRFKLIASSISPYEEKVRRLSPLSLLIIESSPDPVEVLKELQFNFSLSSWSKMSEWIRNDLILIEPLLNHQDNRISTWAEQESIKYKAEIEKALLKEKDEENSYKVPGFE